VPADRDDDHGGRHGQDDSSYGPRTVFYRLSDGFLHPLLEHCLRQLLTIAAPKDSN
jgi:hypothetical protein